MKPDFKNDIALSIAVSAFNGTSFSPEKRGEHALQEYADIMSSDYDKLYKLFESENALDCFEDEFSIYHQNCRQRYSAWLHAHGNCISTMIAGPSKFPTRRAEKANSSSDNRYAEFNDFRQRAQKAMRKKLQPYGDGSRIQSNDPDAVIKLREKLASLERAQETMKSGNKIIRDKKLTDAEKIDKLAAIGLGGKLAIQALKPDCMGCIGFPSYALTNNNAEIRRCKQRIDDLLRESVNAGIAMQSGDIRVFEDDGRVQFEFPSKPDDAIRAKLRANAFKWSPTRKTWVRMANERARNVAKSLFSELQE